MGSVVAACDGADLSILAEIGPSGAELTLIGGDDGWRREAAAALDAYGARTDADAGRAAPRANAPAPRVKTVFAPLRRRVGPVA